MVNLLPSATSQDRKEQQQMKQAGVGYEVHVGFRMESRKAVGREWGSDGRRLLGWELALSQGPGPDVPARSQTATPRVIGRTTGQTPPRMCLEGPGS